MPPGIYYVVVASYEGEPGEYTIHAQAVTDPGSSTDTAARLVLGSPTGGTMDTPEDADYFRLYFPESTHTIIEARTGSLWPINAELLDAQGREISANVYRLTAIAVSGRIIYRFWHGFEILDDFGPGTYYLRVTTPAETAPRPVTYTIYAYEDEEYTEYTEECEAKSRELNDPQINDPCTRASGTSTALTTRASTSSPPGRRASRARGSRWPWWTTGWTRRTWTSERT